MSLPKPHQRSPSAPVAPAPARDAGPQLPRPADHPRRFVTEREQRIDDELAQSFPASDPPGWVLGSARPPR